MNVHLKFIIAVALLAGSAGVFAQQRPAGAAQSIDALMGAALHQEEVDGDFQAAAATYKKVLANPRATAEIRARAQAQLDRIAAQAAGTPLTRTPPTAASATTQRLWNKYAQFGVPSPDGTLVTFVSHGPGEDGNLFVRDVTSGTVRKVTNRDADAIRPTYAGESAFSPDGRQIAYGWKQPERFQLRVIGTDGSGERTITDNPEHEWVSPVGWSADRSRILVKISAKGDVGQIAWVTVATGAIEVLKSGLWSALGRVALSPDGQFIAFDERMPTNPAARTIYVLSHNGDRRTALTAGASRDEVVGWFPDGKSLAYLSYRSGSAEVWAVGIRDGNANGAAALIKRDIGGITPLGFAANGALFYTQIVTTGTAHVGAVDWTSGRIEDVRTISTNLIADFGADWSPDGKRIAYVAHRGTEIDRRFIAVYSIADGSTTEVVPADDLSIAITGSALWSPDGKTYQVNGASTTGRGARAVDVTTGKLRTLITVSNGYPQTPNWLNQGKALLYHPYDQMRRSARLLIRDLETGLDRAVPHDFESGVGIGFRISPDERTIAFVPLFENAPNASTLRVMPLTGGQARTIVEVPAGQNLWPLAWTRDSQHVLYSNVAAGEARTRGPLAETSGLWMVSANGGAPRKLEYSLPNWASLREIRIHPDGRQVTFTVGENQVELWTLENRSATLTSTR